MCCCQRSRSRRPDYVVRLAALPRRSGNETPPDGCDMVRPMIAQQTRNWWWTAHSAAH
ncbi:trp operon leader peptide [Streptomyces sp. NBC_01803]|uniref:trp operon leader peptide n=1 Tax=Streptomyces sp. NBC_01803 TaxID=2975946 RepID=UPI003FA36CAA